MLDFRTPSLSDKKAIDFYLKRAETDGCGYSFGNLYLWRKAYDMTFCIKDGFLFISSILGDSRAFAVPVGDGDLRHAMAEVCQTAKAMGVHPIFYAVTDRQKAAIEEACPGIFFFCDERDYYDYIYKTENLALLPGKKYHGKRNHISRFERDHSWHFETINEQNLADCSKILEEWRAGKFPDGTGTGEADAETDVARESIRLFFELEYEGGILYADGQPAAYAMGEALSDSVFCTHIEKAAPAFRDAYALINRETAKSLLGRYEYIDREDDAGDEGLRKAKLSYYPDILLVKSAASYHSYDELSDQ